jgi:small subunit ribosomal protein S8
MNITDPIADLLTRIRNAQAAGLEVVNVPASKMKIGITHLLKEEGYVRAYKCVRDDKQGILKIALKYAEGNGKGVIKGIDRKSRPSRRYYVMKDQIPMVKNGFGIGILSTSKGLMTDRQARETGVGGEYLCAVY